MSLFNNIFKWIFLFNILKFFDKNHSFHRDKVYHVINSHKFENLLKNKKGIVFIYGEWCEHSNNHKVNYLNFAQNLKKKGSKINFYILHINNLKEISITILNNPTIIILKGNNNYDMLKLDHNFDFMVDQVNYFRYKIRNILIKKVNNLKKFDKIVNSNKETILLITYDNYENLSHFLRLADYKYHYQPKFILTNSKEILNNYNFQNNSLFLFRKEDKKWIKYDKDNRYLLHNIINWLFVHSHPHVLQMEKEGYEKIIHHENNAFILFLEDIEENKNSNNRMIEEFEEASEKIPESFIKTICYVGKPKCNKLINEIDMNLENEKLPILRILIENDSHYLIIYDKTNFINKESILQFYDNFMNGKTSLYLKEENVENGLNDEENDDIIINLNTSTIDKFLEKNDYDRFVFYYKNSNKEWINFINEIFEVLKEQNDLNIKIGLYNIEKNAKFIVKDYKYPMIKSLKKNMNKNDKFWYQDNLKSQNDILYFILDNSTNDYSELFKDHDF